MNSKIKKIIGGLILTAALTAISSLNLNAGERGCMINPDNLQGACMKNTENSWNCIADTEPMDCTSSN